MSTHTTLIERLQDEADLCRNDGADDIARLLDEAAQALKAPPAATAAPVEDAPAVGPGYIARLQWLNPANFRPDGDELVLLWIKCEDGSTEPALGWYWHDDDHHKAGWRDADGGRRDVETIIAWASVTGPEERP